MQCKLGGESVEVSVAPISIPCTHGGSVWLLKRCSCDEVVNTDVGGFGNGSVPGPNLAQVVHDAGGSGRRRNA